MEIKHCALVLLSAAAVYMADHNRVCVPMNLCLVLHTRHVQYLRLQFVFLECWRGSSIPHQA